MALGYTKEEVIQMTKALPTLYGYNIENIIDKINLLRQINLKNVALTDTKRLMQSVDLTYARYAFFKHIDIQINEDCYLYLFYSNKAFESKYGVSKSYLLDTYSYREYKERIKNESTI